MGPSASPPAQPRRGYERAEAVPEDSGAAVALDGRAARTPGGRPLVLPTVALAGLIAAEWAAQGDRVAFSAMPLTRLAFTVIDSLEGAGVAIAAEVARYGANDVLGHFADGPQDLVDRQTARWTPMLEWAREALGVDLAARTGLTLTPQRPEAVALIARLVEAMEPFAQAGVAYATPLFGSAVLALALQRGRLDADDAFDLSRLDEAFQEERWGIDAEAATRTAGLREDVRQLGRWFHALAR